MRSKRIKAVKAHLTTDLFEQLELFKSEESTIVSMSDYLFGVIEQHCAFKSAMRVSKQKTQRRVGES